MLDEAGLEEALRLSGERTYSSVVNRALADFVRRARAGRILDLAGSGLWEGSLAEMRDGLQVNEPKAKRSRRDPR